MRTLNLDSLPTRRACTPGSLINKFFCFDSIVVLGTTPIVTPIAPARQQIHSTCTGGNASIVSYPPADATLVSGVCGICTVNSRRQDNKNSTTAERPQEEIERRDHGNCETGNSTVREGSCSGRSKFVSRWRAEQVRVQAASRASSESRRRADSQKPGDTNAGQSTVCHLPEHHTTRRKWHIAWHMPLPRGLLRERRSPTGAAIADSTLIR